MAAPPSLGGESARTPLNILRGLQKGKRPKKSLKGAAADQTVFTKFPTSTSRSGSFHEEQAEKQVLGNGTRRRLAGLGEHVPVTPSRQQPSAPSRRVRAMATRGGLPVALSWLPVANHHPPTTSLCPFDCLASPLDKLSMAIPVVRCRLEQQFPRRPERRDSAAPYPRQQDGQHTPRFLFSEQS